MLEADGNGEIGEFFKTTLLKARKAVSPADFRRFAALNSNGEKIAFVLSYPETRLLPLEVENVVFKDSENARKLKETGNKFFCQAKYTKALETYSNAVLLAPKNELGVMLANRSASLYHLGRYEDALQDADEALKIGYPKELQYKLEERRAKCHLALQNDLEAIEAFRATLKSLDWAKVASDKRAKLEVDVRSMLVVMEKGMQLKSKKKAQIPPKKVIETKENKLPKISQPNPMYPNSSDAIEIRISNEAGRYGVATRDIIPGELLIVEKPHCAFLLPEYRLTHCHCCFAKIVVPFPAACYTCNSVAYCSPKCREADAETHLVECYILPTLWMSSASITCFLAIKTVIQKPYQEMLKLKEKLKTVQSKEIVRKRPFKGSNYLDFYSLVTHEDERTPEDIFHRAFMASWLLRLLKRSSYLPEEMKTPDSADTTFSEVELFFGELLFHHLQLMQFNSHEISELTSPKGDRTLANAKSIFIGGGIFPTAALLNHSCNPGIIRYFVGTTMVARAVRTIRTGEEISDNYGPIFTITPESERKRKLRVQYWFHCSCEACLGHWPILDDLDPTILRFKCETGRFCRNVLNVRNNTNEFIIPCVKCGKSTNILKGLKLLQDTDQLFRLAADNLEKGLHDRALKNYLKILKLLDETLALPIKDYHICQQGVRLCMLALGNITTL
ncbi:SET and MYND domain-containing protein 4-like [Prorops nasuta]|uniref:SET and MYND domain-containing protein 4-like n=1 Tax=Prorops nasuta TaxID=863751 RepID=UPI0034CFE3FB